MLLIHIVCLSVKISERGKLNELQPYFAGLPASKNGGREMGEQVFSESSYLVHE